MNTNKPLPHLTIRSGPWAGTMVRFATVEQLRAVQRYSKAHGCPSSELLGELLDMFVSLQLNAPQPKES